MKTIPLFDDWLLDAHQDIARCFGQAELCTDKVVCEDGDPENGRYKYCTPSPDSVRAAATTPTSSCGTWKVKTVSTGLGRTWDLPNATALISRWQGEKSAADLVCKSARLEFKPFQARIYAIHWDFHIQSGDPVIERI